jgi:RimJ/RimL family protein N-acetyltransferase
VPTDVELLRIEIDTQWEADAGGRLVRTRERDASPAPDVVIAGGRSSSVIMFGQHVPGEAARVLRAVVRDDGDAAGLPSVVELAQRWLGPIERSKGPCYVIPEGTRFAPTAEVVCLGGPGSGWQRRVGLPPYSDWGAEEWELLFKGELGPCAMAISDDQVISICHTARLSEGGAEAGVWTDPRARGRGHAASVTAAWATLLAPSGRHLFYSTSDRNLSSQKVAERLELHPIGWMCSLWRARGTGGTTQALWPKD